MREDLKSGSKSLIHQARNIFISGLVALLPVIVTIFIVFWLAGRVDSLLNRILPERYEIPGVGLLMAIVLVFLVGLWTKVWFGRKMIVLTESILARIPLVRAIYGSARDIMNLFAKTQAHDFNQVAMVEFPGMGFKMLGFVTRTDLHDLPPEVAEGDRVAVYLPLAYQMGGLVVLVEKANLRPVDMSLQSAIRFVVTAGVSRESHIAGETARPDER
ncbi:DUF502 domain-containing protein [bacterium]|nr:DUF502 domain-containing protein [bacterium]